MRTRSEKTKEIIVDAAKSLFLEKGYTATTLDEIAIKASTTKRTLYGYFADKRALFMYVIDFMIGVGWVFEGIIIDVKTKEELYSTLSIIAEALNRSYSSPEYERLIRVCISETNNNTEIENMLDRGITKRSLIILNEVMQTANERGIVSIPNPEFKARAFAGGLLVGFYTEGLFTSRQTVTRSFTHDELRDYVESVMA